MVLHVHLFEEKNGMVTF